MKLKSVIPVIVLLFIYPVISYSQYIEDALRYAVPNGMITSRVAGFNVAYHGIADDVGALLYNPAGLTLAGRSELSIGLGFTHNAVKTEFLGLTNNMTSNDEFISHIAIIAPFKIGNNNAALGIGYFQESDFEHNLKYDAFNPYSTMIASEAKYGPVGINDNFATYLSLADSTFWTPVQDSLQQTAFIQEKGGIHNITGGISVDINEYFSIGFGLTGKFGGYKYIRNYSEWDSKNVYNDAYDPNDFTKSDFKRLGVYEMVDQSISGFSASVGFQARLEDYMRFGITIKLPTWYEVEENFEMLDTAYFDNGDKSKDPYYFSGRNSYNLTIPFVFCAGISGHYAGLTATAGVEYTDVSQLEFGEAIPEVEQLNLAIVQQLVGQVKWGVGLEYEIPFVPLILRGSYAQTSSPYRSNISNADLTNISVGIGAYFGKNVRVDLVYRMTDVSELRTNYGSGEYNLAQGGQYIFNKKPYNIGLQVTYRY